MENKEDLGIKLGNDDMMFWRDVIEARKIDIQNTKNNLKYYEAILNMAQKHYKKAEKKFNSETKKSENFS